MAVQVLELKAKGYSVAEISKETGITTWHARQILDTINREAREGLLSTMISDRVPLALEQSLELNRIIIRKSLAIAEETKDPRCKLEALRLAKDTNQASNQILADSVIIAKAVQRSAIVVVPSSHTYEHKAKPQAESPQPVLESEDVNKGWFEGWSSYWMVYG